MAKNVAVAKDFLKFVIQPNVVNEYLKTGLGRVLPAMPDLVKNDPFWLDPKDPHRSAHARQGVLGPTVPNYPIFNPGCAEADAQQIWGTAALMFVGRIKDARAIYLAHAARERKRRQTLR